MSAAEALAPEQSVDEVRESLSVTEKGQPANTIGNCRTVFCHDPLLRDAIRLNLLTDRVDIVRDLGWRRTTSALPDTDVKYLLLYFEQNYGLTSEKKMTAALSIVANENCYHPIQDVLNGLVWDGTPRIRSCLHHFLGAEVSDYVEEMLKHFLLGAIRRHILFEIRPCLFIFHKVFGTIFSGHIIVTDHCIRSQTVLSAKPCGQLHHRLIGFFCKFSCFVRMTAFDRNGILIPLVGCICHLPCGHTLNDLSFQSHDKITAC